MTTNIDQYTIETTWSNRLAENIIMDSIKGKIPEAMESRILTVIEDLNNHKYIENKVFPPPKKGGKSKRRKSISGGKKKSKKKRKSKKKK